MFLSNKPSRLATAAKSRINAHSHKLDNIESRKRSPDGNPHGSIVPSEVLVFNNTGNHGGGGNRSMHNNARSLPDVPQADEIAHYFKESWNQKLREIDDRKLSVLWIRRGEDDREISRKDGCYTPGASHPPTPKQKHSPQHFNRK